MPTLQLLNEAWAATIWSDDAGWLHIRGSKEELDNLLIQMKKDLGKEFGWDYFELVPDDWECDGWDRCVGTFSSKVMLK